MTCVHHWLIPAPNGEMWLMGMCKHCGAEKRFLSSYDYEEVHLWRDYDRVRPRAKRVTA